MADTNSEMIFTGVRLPRELRDRVKAEADSEGRTLSNYVRVVLNGWVKHLDSGGNARAA